MDQVTLSIQSLSLSGNDKEKCVAYLCQLSSAKNKSYFPLRWPGVLVQNCANDGNLLDLWDVNKINSMGKQPWLFVSLKIFHSQVINANFY